MKKEKFKGKLSLNKQTVSKLTDTQMGHVNGGAQAAPGFSDGCTDGCGPIFQSAWNCTKADCTADCGSAPNLCQSLLKCPATK